MKLPSRYHGARKHMLEWTKFYLTYFSTLSARWTMNMKICLLKTQHPWASERISFYFSLDTLPNLEQIEPNNKRQSWIRKLWPHPVYTHPDSYNLATVVPAVFMFHTLQKIYLYLLCVCRLSKDDSNRGKVLSEGPAYPQREESTQLQLLEIWVFKHRTQQSDAGTKAWAAGGEQGKHEEGVRRKSQSRQKEDNSIETTCIFFSDTGVWITLQEDSRSVVSLLYFPTCP